jgi:Zn-dependent protease with chaperone function/predicted amidophosphoribosyltransferase
MTENNKKTRKTFTDISYRAFQHPSDSSSLEAIKKLSILPAVIKKLDEYFSEKAFLLTCLSDNLKIGPGQCPKLYNMFREAADILAIKELPSIYINSSCEINTFTFGRHEYTITVYSGLLDIMSEDELMFIIGHELSHIKCEHMLYKSMAFLLEDWVTNLMSGFISAAISQITVSGLMYSLLAWSKKAELSCDRGGLLVVQDGNVASAALAKLAGGSNKYLTEINMEELIIQASTYEDMDEKLLWRAAKLLKTMGRTHTYPIVRAKEIIEWSKSEEYKDILNGKYLTIDEEKKEQRQKTCSKCKATFSSNASFCTVCGSKIEEVVQKKSLWGSLFGKEEKVNKCKKCSSPLKPDWKVCGKCGTKIEDEAKIFCPACSGEIEANWKICPHCTVNIEEFSKKSKIYCKHCNCEMEPEWALCPSCATPKEEFIEAKPLMAEEISETKPEKEEFIEAKPLMAEEISETKPEKEEFIEAKPLMAEEISETKPEKEEFIEAKPLMAEEISETKPEKEEIIEAKPLMAEEISETKPEKEEFIETKPLMAEEISETKPEKEEFIEAKPLMAEEISETKPEKEEIIEAKPLVQEEKIPEIAGESEMGNIKDKKSEIRFCIMCGNSIQSEWNICPSCGNKIVLF